MLDPVKNAKATGLIIFVLSLFDLPLLLNLSDNLIASGLTAISVIGSIVVGFGLYKTKAWAVYGIGLLALAKLLFIILGAGSSGAILILLIYGFLFFWFLSAKSRFSQ